MPAGAEPLQRRNSPGSWCLIRITYITITVSILHDIRVVFWAYPITWGLSGILFTLYFKSQWKNLIRPAAMKVE